MSRRDLLILGFTFSLVTLSLILTTFYPAMSAAINRPPKKPIPGRGLVKAAGLGVYWDENCTKAVSSVEWGMIDPGSQVDKTIYIKNQGDAIVTLAMGTENWNPSTSSSYISLAWDYAGQALAMGEVIAAKFTLSVLENARGNFSFDTVIAAV